jgi:putative FmdB family regulatory protein
MPIYEYKCHVCGEVSEFLISGSSERSAPSCPGCGNRNLERMISAPNLLKNSTTASGKTCCGREERCETPACSTGNRCRRH